MGVRVLTKAPGGDCPTTEYGTAGDSQNRSGVADFLGHRRGRNRRSTTPVCSTTVPDARKTFAAAFLHAPVIAIRQPRRQIRYRVVYQGQQPTGHLQRTSVKTRPLGVGTVLVITAWHTIHALVMHSHAIALLVVLPEAEGIQDLLRLGRAARVQRMPAILLGARHDLTADDGTHCLLSTNTGSFRVTRSLPRRPGRSWICMGASGKASRWGRRISC